MATHGGEAEKRPDRLGEQPLSSGVSTDELRAQFEAQGRPGLAEGRRRDARQARGMYAALAGLVAVVCLVLIGVRLGQGDALGVWVATYAMGVALGGWGFVLARIGHTRWAMMVTCIAGVLAGLGDSPAFR
ncbi:MULTISPECIES: hypothetical protein [unclassified Streptomyces]|uniref:hypothetical protein n=1 Tax=unclassified Streptomyces TaxID=2593676 RepID=UPI002366975D|nr:MULTISPECIES: hypothetical protein [unclassified Streptomyces]MDF3140174.1 hypothetical protein [Streptomyces sp. T21Q-yed]WDF41716.1 hypothetical protein PBV52_35440 [Streptomyces sp. T12]